LPEGGQRRRKRIAAGNGRGKSSERTGENNANTYRKNAGERDHDQHKGRVSEKGGKRSLL